MNAIESFDPIISMDHFYASADWDISYFKLLEYQLSQKSSQLFSLSINTSAIMLRFQSLVPTENAKILFISNRLLQTQLDFLDEFQPSVQTTKKVLMAFLIQQISKYHHFISLTSVKCNK